MRVNIGCGHFPLPGFVNCDADPTTPAELHITVPPLPWEDGTVEDIYLGHVLEHFEPLEGQALLAECHRVLKPGGRIGVVVPDTREISKRYVAGRLDLDEACADYFYSITQPSRHKWSYDLDSLGRVLTRAGFLNLTPINRWTDPRIAVHVWYGCGWDGVKGAA